MVLAAVVGIMVNPIHHLTVQILVEPEQHHLHHQLRNQQHLLEAKVIKMMVALDGLVVLVIFNLVGVEVVPVVLVVILTHQDLMVVQDKLFLTSQLQF